MERFWNIIHFFAYKFWTKFYMSSVKIATWYYNTALVKKIFEKNGRNAEMAMKELKFAMSDKRVGQGSFWAYGTMIAIILTFLCLLHFCYLDYYDTTLSMNVIIYPIVFFGILSGLLNYFLLLHKDKYLKYFKKFEKQPREWKVKWAWISAGFISFPVIVLIGILIISIINVKYS